MPTTLFFSVPAYGHVYPSLSLVAELAQRGHRVVYVTTETFRHTVEVLGAEFHPYTAAVPDDYFVANNLDGDRPLLVSCSLITTAEQALPEALALARQVQPDYIMFDVACTWGQLVARILNLPAIVSSSLVPLTTPPLRDLLVPDMLGIILYIAAVDFLKGLEASRRSKALAAKYNIEPLGWLDILNGKGDLIISYGSTYFQPYLNTVASNVCFIGRRLSDAPIDPSFSFERVDGRRLIYISLGTINNDDISFFKTCIDALAGSDNFVIMSTGQPINSDMFGALPDNIAIYDWVPQHDVLRRTSVFISHSGLGSVHDSLYFGVPLLLIPQQGDQYFVAKRVVELGAGLLLKKHQVTVEAIRTNTAKLLAEPRFKTEAVRIGDSFREAGGAAKGADEIEALLRHRTII
jgi:MGT family glycosyltransferase